MTFFYFISLLLKVFEGVEVNAWEVVDMGLIDGRVDNDITW